MPLYNPICECKTPQFAPIVFNTIAYQNSANNVYNSINSLPLSTNGNPTFKSDYARMQYLLGRQNQGSCGVPKRVFSLGTN